MPIDTSPPGSAVGDHAVDPSPGENGGEVYFTKKFMENDNENSSLIFSPPLGFVDGQFFSPPAFDLLLGEEGASSRDGLSSPTTDLFLGKERDSPSKLRAATRSCARLMSVRQVSALDRAKLRKAALLEADSSGPSSVRCQRISKKVLKKSALCGVKLTGVEAEELHKFVQRG